MLLLLALFFLCLFRINAAYGVKARKMQAFALHIVETIVHASDFVTSIRTAFEHANVNVDVDVNA